MNLIKYVTILESCSSGKMLAPREHDTDELDKVLILLRKEELISFDNSISICAPITLTPKGAMVMIEWRDFVFKRTFKYKFISGTSRFFWIALGALLASIKEIIELVSS